MGILKRWNGAENVAETRRKLRRGDIVRSFGGAFAAKVTPIGGVRETCLGKNTWETKYRTVDEYIASLYD